MLDGQADLLRVRVGVRARVRVRARARARAVDAAVQHRLRGVLALGVVAAGHGAVELHDGLDGLKVDVAQVLIPELVHRLRCA